jgi:hypothetical protein
MTSKGDFANALTFLAGKQVKPGSWSGRFIRINKTGILAKVIFDRESGASWIFA